MTRQYFGKYPIDARQGEIERLQIQADAIAPETERMLDMIGVATGWRCVDLGCGPGGITEALSRRVGPQGEVVGVDMNAGYLEVARATASPNVRFEIGDVYDTSLPAMSFDLVHLRFVAGTVGDPERLLVEAKRIARPGGIIAMQEPDGTTLNCYPPHPAWSTLKDLFMRAFESVGADLELAQKLYYVVRQAKLEDVHYRPFILGVRASDPMVDYLPSTLESMRRTIVERGLMCDEDLSDALARCRAHLRHQDTSFTMYTVAQVWGRNPVEFCF